MSITDRVYLKDGGLYWKDNSERVGCLNHEGYRVFGLDGKQYKEHREIFFIVNGYYPNQIDHIDGNKSNNIPENLRSATSKQNQYNRKDILGYRFKRGKYEARISHDGKRLFLGNYNCPTAARLAYLKAAKELYGDYYAY